MCSIGLQMSESCRNLRYTPDLPSISHKCHICTNTPDTRNVDVWENSNFIYGITRAMCLENKRVSPEAFWLRCLELLPLESHCRKRGTTHCHKHWICSPLETEPVQSACRTPSPRDSKPLSGYLVAKGIVSRTLTSLCTKYRGILICYHKLHP